MQFGDDLDTTEGLASGDDDAFSVSTRNIAALEENVAYSNTRWLPSSNMTTNVQWKSTNDDTPTIKSFCDKKFDEWCIGSIHNYLFLLFPEIILTRC